MSNDTELKKILNQLKENEDNETLSESTQPSEKMRKYNAISSKIFTISLILKWLGYLSAVIACVFFIFCNQIILGLLTGLLSALSTFILTTFLDGFAEIIQLLEDIKNK